MTTFDADAAFLSSMADQLAEATSRPMFPIKVPTGTTDVDVPYALLTPAGGTWSRALLQREHAEGWRNVQIMFIGKGIDRAGVADYVWLAGKTRAALDEGSFAGDGWKVAMVDSLGQPYPTEAGGELLAVVETYGIYVQAE